MKQWEAGRKPATLCVHADAGQDPTTGAINTPVYFTSTYAQKIPGKHKGYEYSRTHNPTRSSLETALSRLEEAKFAAAFASGMAAEDALLHLLNPGDEVLCSLDIYGGTHRLMMQIRKRYGLRFRFIDTTKPKVIAGAITSKTRMIWVETPSNPLVRISPIKEISRIAHARKILLVVDNTFATPVLQKPLKLGADLVIHSTTKYIAGHSDVIGGAVITNRADLDQKIKFHQNSAGAVPGPMDCYLTLRGIKTLALRMSRHCANAEYIAEALMRHKRISKVYYPGIGGIVSFLIRGGKKEAMRFYSKLELFSVAESLGGVESLACYPWIMTHAAIPKSERIAAGITDNLVRLSVGIEDPKDLLKDLLQALK